MEFTKPDRNIKHPTDAQTKCSGKRRNRNYALQVIPPEPGMKPSDSISNFHGKRNNGSLGLQLQQDSRNKRKNKEKQKYGPQEQMRY